MISLEQSMTFNCSFDNKELIVILYNGVVVIDITEDELCRVI